jgi:hypothetical protein
MLAGPLESSNCVTMIALAILFQHSSCTHAPTEGGFVDVNKLASKNDVFIHDDTKDVLQERANGPKGTSEGSAQEGADATEGEVAQYQIHDDGGQDDQQAVSAMCIPAYMYLLKQA